MKLARQQLEEGNYRLAMRAYFLASFAHLGDRELIRVARFKSNRDYRRELALKGARFPDLQEAFGENVRLFEYVWYGMHDMRDESVSSFMRNYETITDSGDA